MYSLPTGDDFYYGDASEYEQHLIDKFMGKVKSERLYTEQDLEDAFCAGKKRQRWEMPVDKAGFDGTPPMFMDWLEELKEQKANEAEEEAGREASDLMRLVR